MKRGWPRSRLWPAVLGLTALLSGCQGQPGIRFVTATPREEYEVRLRDAGLDATALGRDWTAAAARALTSPVTVGLPHREVRYLDPRQAAAAAYRLSLERGQRLAVRIDVAGAQPSDLRFFVDLFHVPDSLTLPSLVASADSSGWEFEYVALRPGAYVLRLQPELLRGGRVTLTVSAHASLAFPVAGMDLGILRSGFGAPRDAGRREHHGLDLFAPRGTPVLAATYGRVSRTGTNQLGGNVVWLRDERHGLRLYYAHLDRHAVEEDTWVEPGDTLGYVGNTGNARTTPPHLHFGIYVRRQGPVDPYYHLFEPPGVPPAFAGDSSLVGALGQVVASGGRLRARPDRTASVIATLAGAAPIEVLAGAGQWYRARLPGGDEGYVSQDQVRPLRTLYSGMAADGGILRSLPGLSGAAMDSVVAGEVLAVLGRYEDQAFVRQSSGLLGWVPLSLLVSGSREVAGSP